MEVQEGNPLNLPEAARCPQVYVERVRDIIVRYRSIISVHPTDYFISALPLSEGDRGIMEEIISLSMPRMPPDPLVCCEPPPPPPLSSEHSKFTERKKRHEISAMVGQLKGMGVEGPSYTVVDVGAGSEALSRLIADECGCRVIAIDQSEDHHKSADRKVKWLRRQGAKEKGKGKGEGSAVNSLDRIRRVKATVTPDALLEDIIGRDSSEEVGAAGSTSTHTSECAPSMKCLVGLHACGDLSSILIRWFASLWKGTPSQNIKVLSVGCCYNLMTCTTFPMSRWCRTHAPSLELSPDLLAAAAQSTTPDFLMQSSASKRSSVVRKRLFRAFLQHLIHTRYPSLLPSMMDGGKRVKLKPPGDGSEDVSLSAYVVSSLQSLGVGGPLPLALPSADDIEEEGAAMFAHHHELIREWFKLRQAASLLIEELIVFDRAMYLFEAGIPVTIKPLFDSSLSPRNLAIIAGTRSISWSGPDRIDFVGENSFYSTFTSQKQSFGIGKIFYTPDVYSLLQRPTRSLNDIAVLQERGRTAEVEEGGEGEGARLLGADPEVYKDDDNAPPSRCSWMRAGSVGGSIFNMCGNTLGAGALSLPGAFANSGYGAGIAFLFLAAITCYFTIALLVDVREFTGLRSIEELMVVCYGRKWALALELNILVLCFGTAVAYTVAVGDLATPLLSLTPIYQGQGDDMRLYVMAAMWLFIMAPLCCLREMTSLRFTSAMGVTSIFFLAIVCTYSSIENLEIKGWANSWGRASVVNADLLHLLKAIPVVMFAFTCQINIIPIYNDLKKPSAVRMMKVVRRSLSISVVVYFLMALFGYLNFPTNTASNILSNYCVDENKNPLYISAYFAILFTVSFAFPLVVFPIRHIMSVLIFRCKILQETDGSLVRQMLGFILSGLALLIALKVPNISLVFSIVGGTSSAFTCFIVPSMLSLKLGRSRSSCHKFLSYAVAIGSGFAGLVSTAYTLYAEFVNVDVPPKLCT